MLSSFGVMFTPNHVRAASELVRVCRPEGRIGLANWTPRGFIGRLFAVVGRICPRRRRSRRRRWGVEDHYNLFRASASDIHLVHRDFVFRYRSPEHWIEVFRTGTVPCTRRSRACRQRPASAGAGIDPLIKDFNTSGDSTMVVPGEYLEVVVVRR